MPPPNAPATVAELKTIVELVRLIVSVPDAVQRMPPPTKVAVLSLTVLVIRVNLPTWKCRRRSR